MIHRFAVSNYHSIREEVVLDLRIPGTAPDQPRFRRSVARPDVRLPTVAVLMGPNGSGKTTLLRALITLAELATEASPSDTKNPIAGVVAFASKTTWSEPIRFCLDIEADWLAPGEGPKMFRYEVVVGRDSPDVRSAVFWREALSHFPKGRRRCLFERGRPGEPIRVADEIADEIGLGSKDGGLRAIQDQASALATFALLKAPFAVRVTEWFKRLRAASNITRYETWALPTEQVIEMMEERSELMRPWVEKHIQSSDLGIESLRILNVDVAGESKKKEIFLRHSGLDIPVALRFESSGTKRLFQLLPQLCISLNLGTPTVFDEIDGDLHVDIVGDILSWYQSQESNSLNAQLLVSSHNVGLLDDLEKEEVFVVEKTDDGATRVHGGQDVRGLRRDARLYPKYRAGVLGGIPKIG